MTHGIIESVVPCGLVYSGDPGGLNEATSDIFGTMVEFSAHNTADPGDYLIGEKLNLNGNGTPLRYMYDPSLDGASDNCWSSTVKTHDVHYSSGVANHFVFDLAEGTGSTAYGTSPVCGSAPPVAGIGRSKAEKIWFRALDVYFTSSTSYVNTSNPGNTARAYTVSAAADLYGACSTEYKAVQAAWNAVNVAGAEVPCDSNAKDFTIALAPASGVVTAGGSACSNVSTATVVGSPQTVTFNVFGLPAGAVAGMSPSSLTSGASSMLTIATTTTPAGTYTVTITGTGTSTHTATFTLTVNAAPGACPGPGQKLGNPGFETGTAPWTGPTAAVGSWPNKPARTGTRDAWLGDNGKAVTETISQPITLPAGCATSTLSFWLRIDTAETGSSAYDTLRVQILNASGTALATPCTFSNATRGTAYTRSTVSLAAYAGQSIIVRFTETEDSSLQTSFVIDDTTLVIS